MQTTAKQTEISTSLWSVEPYNLGPFGMNQSAWDLGLPFIDISLAYGKINLQDIYEGCLDHRYTIWLIYHDDVKGVFFTRIGVFPRKRICEIMLMNGEGMEEWLEIGIEKVKDWAKSQNCDSVEIYGRPGWSRVLNIKPTSQIVSIEL